MLVLIFLPISVCYLQINSKIVGIEQNRIKTQINAFIITYDCTSVRFNITKKNIERVFPNYFHIYCFKSIPLNDSRVHTASSSVAKKFSSHLITFVEIWTHEIPKYSTNGDNQWSFVFEDDVDFIEPSKASLSNYINPLEELMQNPEIQLNHGVFYLGICGPTFPEGNAPLLSKSANNTLSSHKGYGWCTHAMGLTTKRAKTFWVEISLYRPSPEGGMDLYLVEFCSRSKNHYYTLGSNLHWPPGIGHVGIAFQDRGRFQSGMN
jgi:hypothetical protein